MNEQQNIEIAKRCYETFSADDIPALLELFAEDIKWRAPQIEGAPYSGNYDGRDEVGGFFSTLGETEEFSNFEPREYIAQDDRVVVLGSMTATVNDTGREYQSDWVHIFTLRDGKVADFLEFFDTAAASKAFQKASAA